MCILLLIGLVLLMTAFSPVLALIFGIGAAINGAQKKRIAGQPPVEKELLHSLALRIAGIAILLLGAFIACLVIRYWMT